MPRAADASRGAEDLEILSGASVMRVSCEVARVPARELPKGHLATACAGATQRVEALAIDEANVYC